MPIRSIITGLSFVLVAVFVQPAQAAEIIAWDQEIAGGVHEDLVAGDGCRYSGNARSQRSCGGKGFEDGVQRIPSNRAAMIDRIALFVYRYKDLKLDEQIRPGTTLTFDADFSNVYEQQATVVAVHSCETPRCVIMLLPVAAQVAPL